MLESSALDTELEELDADELDEELVDAAFDELDDALVEVDAAEELLEVDVDGVAEDVELEPVPVVSAVLVVELSVVDVVDSACAAVWVTPAMRPTVAAVAPTEAATPTSLDLRNNHAAGRLGPGRPFMSTTMCRRGSGCPYATVKSVLMLAG